MSHPFRGTPSLPFDITSNPQPPRPTPNISLALASLPEPRKAYKYYYASASAASEMDLPKEDLHTFLRGYFHLKSADWSGNDPQPLKGWQATELAKMPYYYIMPLAASMREAVAVQLSISSSSATEITKQGARWLNDAELNIYVQDYARNGFQGPLNWYRAATDPTILRDVEAFAGRNIDVPALFVAGRKDWGTYQEPGVIERMDKVCTQLRGVELLEGAGHWVQQEQPEKVVELVAKFLRDIKKDAVLL